jgi:hypothetical protein
MRRVLVRPHINKLTIPRRCYPKPFRQGDAVKPSR